MRILGKERSEFPSDGVHYLVLEDSDAPLLWWEGKVPYIPIFPNAGVAFSWLTDNDLVGRLRYASRAVLIEDARSWRVIDKEVLLEAPERQKPGLILGGLVLFDRRGAEAPVQVFPLR